MHGVYLFSSADKGKARDNRIRARRRPITFVSSFFQAANVAYRPSNAAERLVVESRVNSAMRTLSFLSLNTRRLNVEDLAKENKRIK